MISTLKVYATYVEQIFKAGQNFVSRHISNSLTVFKHLESSSGHRHNFEGFITNSCQIHHLKDTIKLVERETDRQRSVYIHPARLK
jgi:hypothetical protein